MAASAVWHGAETRAAFCCKHLSAAGPPGCTPEQCAMKSDRHAARMALSCSLLGFCDAASVAAAGAGLAAAAGGCGLSAEPLVGRGAIGTLAAGTMALTAVLQDADNLASLRLRHSNAFLPPGCTPEQLAMKSERHDARITSRCAWLGSCATASVTIQTMHAAAIRTGEKNLDMRNPR